MYPFKDILQFHKSFSPSAARYRRRKISRAFRGGITSSFTSWKIMRIRFGQTWARVRRFFIKNPTELRFFTPPANPEAKDNYRLNWQRYYFEDTKRRPQHRE